MLTAAALQPPCWLLIFDFPPHKQLCCNLAAFERTQYIASFPLTRRCPTTMAADATAKKVSSKIEENYAAVSAAKSLIRMKPLERCVRETLKTLGPDIRIGEKARRFFQDGIEQFVVNVLSRTQNIVQSQNRRIVGLKDLQLLLECQMPELHDRLTKARAKARDAENEKAFNPYDVAA
jgi:histone H3/H4